MKVKPPSTFRSATSSAFADEPVRLPSKTGKTVYAPALGNKLCAAVLAELAHKTEPADAFELSFAFCAQSALGARGAAPAAFSLTPDIAVCFEPYEGKTPGIRIADRFLVSDGQFVKDLTDAAAQIGMTLTPQIDSEPLFTDAARIGDAGQGVRTVTLLYPVNAKGSARERADVTLCGKFTELLLQVSASALMQKVPYSRTEKRRCKTGEKRKRIAKPTAFFGVSALPVHARHKNAVAGKGRLFG